MFDVFTSIDLPTLIKIGGYSGLFAIIFAESGLFFGFFLPGDSLLFTAGFLASQGYLNVWILIPLLIVAAVAGNSVGFSFGKYVGPILFQRSKSRFFNPEHAKRAHTFFLQNGKKAILLSRFLPVVRTFVPIIAGVGEMPYKDFMPMNVLGGGLWAGGITFLGYYLGQQVPNAEHYLYPIIGLIIVVSFLPVLLSFRKKRKTSESAV